MYFVVNLKLNISNPKPTIVFLFCKYVSLHFKQILYVIKIKL